MAYPFLQDAYTVTDHVKTGCKSLDSLHPKPDSMMALFSHRRCPPQYAVHACQRRNAANTNNPITTSTPEAGSGSTPGCPGLTVNMPSDLGIA
jgi:hypothetical protein